MRKFLRMFEEGFFKILMKLSLFIIVAVLLTILTVQLYKGLPSLTWSMISETPGGVFTLEKKEES